MTRAVLEVVASTAVSTEGDVMRYIKCTLLATTTDFTVRAQQRPMHTPAFFCMLIWTCVQGDIA